MTTEDEKSGGEAARSPSPPKSDGEPEEGRRPFFIAGVGASAGGLEAMNALFERVTIDDAAFVVVQHLAPGQNSVLAELLGRVTSLRVVTIESGMVVCPNHIYVAPPGAEVTLLNGRLQLLRVAPGERPHLPIDTFFRSLALDAGTQSIGVVLSGTGTDGTFGLAAIKAAGGITFAQEPDSAKFAGMPRNALDAGVADFSLPVDKIADEILQVSQHPYLRRSAPRERLIDQLGPIAALLKSVYGLNLAHYKPNTIERRLQRRMALHRLERIGDYVRMCQNDPKELTALHRDLLINVTAFFRDAEPFEALSNDVLPALMARKRENDAIRVWVPGCASGEEAYSIGICLVEAIEAAERNIRVQIFGTDVDPEAIQQARRGIYPPNIAADVSAERLRRFFIKTEDGRYQISRRIRDSAVFSLQDITRDAPFSKIDIVSCRNVLIYLQPGIQRKVMRILHYSLLPEGCLLLGTSETIGDAAELFYLSDRKNKIYTAKHVTLPSTGLEIGMGLPTPPAAQAATQLSAVRPMITVASLADRKILDEYAPPGVVVNENLDILYFRGRTAPYLENPSGVATHAILRLVRPELHAPIKALVARAFREGEPITTNAQVKDSDGNFRPVQLIAQPIQEPETRAHCLLILFGAQPPTIELPRALPAAPEASVDRARLLAQELALTKDYLQSTIEELERANEDLKSANEELQSSNEELQSTNEELETSKEELQSTNEELITLNEELQNRMRDLGTANDDLHNVLATVDRPLVIVGLDLRIRRFTIAAERVFNLVPTDVGRSIAQLNSTFGGVGIEGLVGSVINEVRSVTQEICLAEQHWYLLRVQPYKTLDLSIRGAVISLVDIDEQKRRGEPSASIDDYAAEFLSAVRHPVLILNGDLRVVWANEAFLRVFARPREQIMGTQPADWGLPWSNPALLQSLSRTVSLGVAFERQSMEETPTRSGVRRLLLSGRRIRGFVGQSVLILLSIEGERDGASGFSTGEEG